jgi:hypothetical protein
MSTFCLDTLEFMQIRILPIILILAAVSTYPAAAQTGILTDLYHLPPQLDSRWASAENPTGERGQGGQENAGRKGRPALPLPAGKQLILAEVSGHSGTVRRIWLTVIQRDPKMLRSLRIDMYWDGARTPAVSAPLGDFFGVGLGRTARFESALFSNPEGRSFNCYIPMPFRTGMKIVVTNEGHTDLGLIFYDVDYTLGDQHGPDMLYFHAYFRHENPTTLQKDYQILPHVLGKGRYLGANLGVIPDRAHYLDEWWGEGEVKIYKDGDREHPTLAGTGSEDYIGTGWGEGEFSNLYQGCTVAEKHVRYCFYRYHVPDPIFFRQEIQVAIQQIGYLMKGSSLPSSVPGPLYRAGPGLLPIGKDFVEGLYERQDDWSSCVYFYLDKPENGLPPIESVDRRIADL